jgi:DNA-binding transcriptional MerR regulator
MTAPKKDFSSKELARLSGLSAHMVNYLCRCDILRPSLSSERRHGLALKFSFADVVLTRVIARLLAAGASVATLKRALSTLRRKLHGVPHDALRNRRVVIIGNAVYLSDGDARILDLTANGQIDFNFVLDVAGIDRSYPIAFSPRKTKRA